MSLEESVILIKESKSIEDIYIAGLVYLKYHKNREAIELFKKILNYQEVNYPAQWGIAEVLRRDNNLEESKKILNNIIYKNPDFSPAYISLAYIKYTELNFKDCMELAEIIIKKLHNKTDRPNLARAYLLFGGAKGMLASKGSYLQKIKYGLDVLPNLKKAEKINPHAPEVLFALGSFYFLAPKIAGGNLQKAEDYLKEAIEKDPLFTNSYVRLAQLYYAQKKYSLSDQYINKAKDIEPNNPLLLDFLNKTCKFNCNTVEEK
ncbi:MAG: tetratricopeptide repeat protein [Candidatus Omnitrophica bacterium]|nr:tetratricopeptide repeat protein [Candidatus Omnitrophota bacterium]MCM8826283.1 tetratricopeptide repeat protein [Candidatus Omnitrophota bacterium]